MPKERFRVPSAVFLILRKGDRVLLHRRCNTGYCDGNYGLVSGHIDGGESYTEALRREAKEEVGIAIDPADIRSAHLLHRFDRPRDDAEYIDVFLKSPSGKASRRTWNRTSATT